MLRHHVRDALSRNLPELADECSPHERTMVVCGSGPSIAEASPEMGDIFALGGAHDWLLDHDIAPHAWINADPMPLVANYVKNPHPDVAYFLASLSHRFVFDALADYHVTIWHTNVGAGYERDIAELRGEGLFISGGPTGATRAPFLGHALGYRKFIFCGVDGSGGHVAAHQRDKPCEDIEVGGKLWSVPRNFIQQASAFETILKEFPEWDIEFRGTGFMAAVCTESRQRGADPGERQIEHEAGAA